MIPHKHRYFGIFGWYGAVAVILAYIFINFSVLSVKSFSYLFLNLSGIIGILVDSFYHKAYESVTVNVIFAVITVVAIINLI